MDFNIGKHLKHKERPLDPTIKVVLEVLAVYVPDIQASNIHIKNGTLHLRSISPQARTHLKLKEPNIIKELTEREVNVRGIL